MPPPENPAPSPADVELPVVVTTVLGSRRTSAAEARQLLRDTLERCEATELADSAELAISEVVTNVWRHTTAEVVPITIRCDGNTVEVCVANTVTTVDGAGRHIDTGRGGSAGEGGFGLRIVEQITSRCGWVHTPVGDAYQFAVSRPQLTR